MTAPARWHQHLLSSPLPLFGISFSSVSPLHPTPHSFPTVTFWYCRTNMEGQWKRKQRKIWGRKTENDFISPSFCPFCTLWHLTLPCGSKGVCGTLLWQHKRSLMIWCWPFFFFSFLMQCNDFNRLIPRRNPTQLGLSISLVWVRLLPELSGCSFFLCTLSNLTSSSLRSEHLGSRKCFSSVFSGLSSLSQWLFKNINGAQKIFFGVCMSDPRTFPNASSQRPCSTFSHQKLLFLIKKEDKFNWAYQLCSNIKFKTILN